MGITIAKKPELDINGERWVHFKVGSDGLAVKCDKGPDTASILVASIANPIYKSHQAVIRRHLAALNQQAGSAPLASPSTPSPMSSSKPTTTCSSTWPPST